MEWSRRAVAGGLAATLVPLRVAAEGTRGAAAATAHPPVAGQPVATLEAGPARLRLQPAPAAETMVWAYNAQVPGPLIRVTKGAEVAIRLVNKLSQPTTLCWHGVRLANAMDGVAGLTQAPVEPGGSFDYRFTPPDAGLYWYHPHVFPHSAEQIGRGLYGVLIVDEPQPPPVDHDLLVVLDDWALDPKSQIKPDVLDAANAGRAGEPVVTVNSKLAPVPPLSVRPGARVRLRVLNVCSARIAVVTLAGMATTIIGIDGQPSELVPPANGTLPIGPGSRFDVMADMPAEAGKAPALLLRTPGLPDRPLTSFKTEGKPMAPRGPVEKLPPNPRLPTRIPLERALKRDIVIGAGTPAKAGPTKDRPAGAAGQPFLWTLDGAGSDGFSGKPLFRVKRGGAVSLAFVNKTAAPQQMHVHGHAFRVLHDLDDGWDPYWRDSILIAPGKTKHVAFIADNPGKWAIESLILDRQVTGLAGWFDVA